MKAMGTRVMFQRWSRALLLAPVALWGQQYSADKAGPPPAALAPAISAAVGTSGFAIARDGKRYCEISLRTSLEDAVPPTTTQPNQTLPKIAVGTLLGAI